MNFIVKALATLIPILATSSAFAAEFEFCFQTTHGRCFAVEAENPNVLREIGLVETKATLPAGETQKFETEITAFFQSTAGAKQALGLPCEVGVMFRSAADDGSVRCLDRLNSQETERFKALLNRLTMASKPTSLNSKSRRK